MKHVGAITRCAREAATLAVALFALNIAACCADAMAEVPPDHAAQMARSLELFKSDIRPLLLEHCVACHGGEKTESEFDLTTREGLLKGGESGPGVVAGAPDVSRLLQLVKHAAEPHMPLDSDQLPPAAIEKLSAWIAAGAAYDQPLVDAAAALTQKKVTDADRNFWSFQPLTRAAIPEVSDPGRWCRTPIDRFILSQLDARGLVPNEPAEKRTLIRRAYFDLVGLPPEPEEVEQFVHDPSDDAYDRLLDRLLGSVHYGERWGRHWLDLARFAESHGYEQDYDRPTAYHYRDFVIQALNDDMPYDQFVRWQIAGDELAPDDHRALMATGFLAAGTHATQITANQVEKERYDELDDMASTVGTAMLGLTIGCARCHDHKFDPIPQTDYYRLVSTFTTTVRSEVELDFQPEIYRQAKADFDAQHAPLVAEVERFEREQLPSRFASWLAEDLKPVGAKWLVAEIEAVKSDGGAEFKRQDDGSLLVSGQNPKHDVYTLIVPTKVAGITAVRLEALPHESLPKSGPGRAANGNFALSDLQVWAAPAGSPTPGAPVKLTRPVATFAQEAYPAASAIDDNKGTAWAIDPEIGKRHAASFELETPLANPQGTTLTLILKFENNDSHGLGRLRFSVSNAPQPLDPQGDEAPEQQIAGLNSAIAKPASERSAAETEALAAWFKAHDPDWQRLAGAVDDHARQAPRPELTKVLAATEGLPAVRLHTQGADFFDKTYFLKRGDLGQKVGEASQSFLQVLMNSPEAERRWQAPPPDGWRTSYRRRALAQWLTDTEQGAGHLLARVIVNRLWQHHMGRGIVATPSDFGASGDRPTHPQLLDYLADRLIAEGWRLKEIHRLIMASAVYRQSTDADARRTALDPDNLLYWRQSRRRLEAESIRDAMLAVSGQLDRTMYGPGTLDESHKRRSIYFTVKRSQLVPSMMLYDAPDSLGGLGQRAATIVAPQALAVLNNAQVHERSLAFARSLAAGGSDTRAAIHRAYQRGLSRAPASDELELSLGFVDRAAQAYAAAGRDEANLLALADFCQVIMGLNEFIYID